MHCTRTLNKWHTLFFFSIVESLGKFEEKKKKKQFFLFFLVLLNHFLDRSLPIGFHTITIITQQMVFIRLFKQSNIRERLIGFRILWSRITSIDEGTE